MKNVRVRGLGHRHGRVRALAGVDLELSEGVTGLLGPNGAGKSTLLRVLATLLVPSEGTVRVGDLNPTAAGDRLAVRRMLGYLPQEPGLYPSFTAFEFVDYVAALKELRDPADRHRRVAAALEAVDLADCAGSRIRSLSGGVRRRIGLAQAIVADPALLLLDEPTAGLDPQQRGQFADLVRRIGRDTTVVLSTHLAEDVAAACNHVVVLLDGRVRFTGTPAALRDLAAGQVWASPEPVAGAAASRLVGDGVHRVVGGNPGPGAPRLEPTVEDGYLLLCGDDTPEVAA